MCAQAGEDWESLITAVRGATPAAALGIHSRVARQVAARSANGDLPKHVERLHVAVLRSITVEPLLPSLVAWLADAGFAADVRVGQLGNIAQEILAPDSFLRREAFGVCVVLTLAEHVVPAIADPSAAPRGDSADAFVDRLDQLAQSFNGLIVACNFALPPQRVGQRLAAQSPDSGRYAVAKLNARLAELSAKRANLVVCDLEALSGEIGGRAFWSPRDNAASMQPFTAEGLVALANRIADCCLLYKRTPIKCIVLDCDNTLWGGIVGEDGPAGIKLGETYPGVCFQRFQEQLASLNRLGFLLALNSKNNEPDVRAVFEQHPGMVLKLNHVAAMRVNWQDKVANMQELAEELNIGLDSFLFIDDNEFELSFVRERLPQVRTLRVPEQPWRLPELLAGNVLVDRLSLTAEDRRKTQMYAQERRREQFKSQAGTFEDYLRGLAIRLTFEPFRPEAHLTRAAQLTQKTNQFNLTTRRYTEADLLALHERGAGIYLASLSDRFGDYGRIALAIALPGEAPSSAGPSGDAMTCRLDVFLMSCRVIGRGVEESFLRLVMRRMRARGFERMLAEFIPTAKNAVSRDFLTKAGLTRRTDRAAAKRDEERRGSNDDAASAAPAGASVSGATAGDVLRYTADLTNIPTPADWLAITEEPEPADGSAAAAKPEPADG